MPKIFTKWEALSPKLDKIESLAIQKRVGSNSTLVFLIDVPRYDSTIPILSTRILEKWLEEPNPPKEQRQATPILSESSDDEVEVIDDFRCQHRTTPNSVKNEIPTSSTSDGDIDLVESEKSNRLTPTEDVEINDTEDLLRTTQNGDAEADLELQNSPNLSDDSSVVEHMSTEEAVCEGQIDRLVINEPIDDEYRYLADDDEADEPESVLSKNLKKIRTEPAKKPQVVPPPPPPPPVQPTVSRELTTTNRTNNSAPVSPSVAREQPPQQIPQPEEPKKPDWPQVAKTLQRGELSFVNRELSHFRNEIKSNDEATAILKEATLKCILEDETNILIDNLKILFEINYNDDNEFWHEVVLRLKRKLNTHGVVQRYKVKTNPEWVHANYKTALASIFEHAKAVNKCLIANVQLSTMMFLMNLSNDRGSDQSSNHVSSRPQVTTNNVVRPMSGSNQSNQSQERQENRMTNLTIPRRVVLSRSSDGKQIFKITAPAPAKSSYKGKALTEIFNPRL